MLAKGAELMGRDKFYTYDAFKNNCQSFIRALLKGVGLYSENTDRFVFQPLDQIVKKIPKYVPIFSKGVTNLAGIVSRLIGKGEDGYNLEED
jgi:hypothetical protein